MAVLSDKDVVVVQQVCVQRNSNTAEQFLGFLRAYRRAKMWGRSSLKGPNTSFLLPALVRQLAELIEPKNNANGLRKLPGQNGCSMDPIQRAMDNFFNVSWMSHLTPDELYTEFKAIMPYPDGNGRIADLIWRLAHRRDTGYWPTNFPQQRK